MLHHGVLVLGIESSCDETAAAVVRDDGTVLADVIASQEAVHARFRGVVPELASRAHLRNAVPVLEQALSVLPNGLADVDAIAVTNGPGLAGALLVGVQLAKSLALVRGVPLVGVDHLVAHLLAARLGFGAAPADVPFPYVGLLVSGGHTATYELRSPLDVQLIAQTRDDAAGEAFDKVAKLVGLGYPGGPLVDALAKEGDASRVKLPRPMASKDSLDMSFSGLKTAVARHVAAHGVPEGQALRDLCAAFQDVVVKTLVAKSLAACRVRGIDRLVLAGG